MNRILALPLLALTFLSAPSSVDAGQTELQQDWQWDRGVPEDRRWHDGVLQVKTQPGRIWGGDGNRNLLVAKQPIGRGGEAVADIELLDATGKFEQCGLLVYVHDDLFVKLVVEHIDGEHYVVMAWEKSGRGQVIAKTKISEPRAQLRLRVSGDQVQGFWRLAEDEAWRAAASCEFSSQQPRKFALFSQDGEPDQRRWAVIRELSWHPQAGGPSEVAPSSAD